MTAKKTAASQPPKPTADEVLAETGPEQSGPDQDSKSVELNRDTHPGTRKVGEAHPTINTETLKAEEEEARKYDPNPSADDIPDDEKTPAVEDFSAWKVNENQFFNSTSPSKNVRLDDIQNSRIVNVDELARKILSRADMLETRYDLIPVFRKALIEYCEENKPYYYRYDG